MVVLHTYEFGTADGPEVLAVHGINAHGRRFERLAVTYWPERRTIAVDLRGHGFSTYAPPWSIRQHVADLLDTLNATASGPVDLVGHSYGGAMGLELLAHAPHRVRRLVLLDPALVQPADKASELALQTIEHIGWRSVEEATMARNAGLGDQIHPAVVADIEQHLVQGNDGRFRFRVHKPAIVTGYGEVCFPLPEVAEPRPTLLVAATRSGIVTKDTVQGLSGRLGHQLTVVQIASGHMLYWERFEETGEIVASFLGR